MFDLGIQELILIFVVALLVFGPKRLPELSKTLGKGVRELKIALRGVKDSLEEAEPHEENIPEVSGIKTTEEKQEKGKTDLMGQQDLYQAIGDKKEEKTENE